MSKKPISAEYERQIERGVALLLLANELQGKADGVQRVEPGTLDRTKVLDDFAMDVSCAVTNMLSLKVLMPMMQGLAELGRKLHDEGKIDVKLGESLSDAALAFVRAEHGLR